VEYDEEIRDFVADQLQPAGREVLRAANAEAALDLLRAEDIAVVVADIYLRGTDGLELLRTARTLDGDQQVVLTGLNTPVKTVVSAMRAGAFAFVEKPIDPAYLLEIVSRAQDERARHMDSKAHKRASRLRDGPDKMVANSAAMQEVLKTIDLVAPSDLTVLIEGESGVGKELVANRIHEKSPRARKPFIAINCGVLQENLLESELFGHERGAFTGAVSTHQGLFEIADGGTLFLDEIGEMSGELQVKLLRVLEAHEFRRLGGHKLIHVDVRVLAATNKRLADEVSRGCFREDLYYRLNVIHLEVPPLRNRTDEIEPLVAALIEKHRRHGVPLREFTPATLEVLKAYPWPGNVRELANLVERMLILADGDQVQPSDLPPNVAGNLSAGAPSQIPTSPLLIKAAQDSNKADASQPLAEVERRHILLVLRQNQGNKLRSARILGINVKTLYNKIKAYGIIEEVQELRSG
jgi:DNA-binding NtrC family response regulator